MKKRNLLKKKMELFYEDVSDKCSQNKKKTRLQTDLEFQQNEIKKLNKKFHFEMFSTNVRDGKAFAAEQKIRELKKLLLKSKNIDKRNKKKINPKKINRKSNQ